MEQDEEEQGGDDETDKSSNFAETWPRPGQQMRKDKRAKTLSSAMDKRQEAVAQEQGSHFSRSDKFRKTLGCSEEALAAAQKAANRFERRRRSSLMETASAAIAANAAAKSFQQQMRQRRHSVGGDHSVTGGLGQRQDASSMALTSKALTRLTEKTAKTASSQCSSANSSEAGDDVGQSSAKAAMRGSGSTLLNPTEASRIRTELLRAATSDRCGSVSPRRTSSPMGSVGSPVGYGSAAASRVTSRGPSQVPSRRNSLFRSSRTCDIQHVLSVNQEVLKDVPILQQCNEEFVDLLMSCVDTVLFTEGTDIIAEGVKGERLYVLIRGKVEITVGETVVAELSDGSIFGEMSLLGEAGGKTCATVRAVSLCECRVIDEQPLRRALKAHPASQSVLAEEARRRGVQLEKQGLMRRRRNTLHDIINLPVTSPTPSGCPSPSMSRRQSQQRSRRSFSGALSATPTAVDDDDDGDVVPEITRRTARTQTIGCIEENTFAGRYERRRRSSVIGFETNNADRRRDSYIGEITPIPEKVRPERHFRFRERLQSCLSPMPLLPVTESPSAATAKPIAFPEEDEGDEAYEEDHEDESDDSSGTSQSEAETLMDATSTCPDGDDEAETLLDEEITWDEVNAEAEQQEEPHDEDSVAEEQRNHEHIVGAEDMDTQHIEEKDAIVEDKGGSQAVETSRAANRQDAGDEPACEDYDITFRPLDTSEAETIEGRQLALQIARDALAGSEPLSPRPIMTLEDMIAVAEEVCAADPWPCQTGQNEPATGTSLATEELEKPETGVVTTTGGDSCTLNDTSRQRSRHLRSAHSTSGDYGFGKRKQKSDRFPPALRGLVPAHWIREHTPAGVPVRPRRQRTQLARKYHSQESQDAGHLPSTQPPARRTSLPSATLKRGEPLPTLPGVPQQAFTLDTIMMAVKELHPPLSRGRPEQLDI